MKVDGKLVHPGLLKPIDWLAFSSDLHITSSNGARFQILTGVKTVDPGSMFSIYTQHKVASSVYSSMENAIQVAWLKQHLGTVRSYQAKGSHFYAPAIRRMVERAYSVGGKDIYM